MLFDTALNWISKNYLEICGSIAGILYVFLTVKKNILLWFFGIINALIYIKIFVDTRIYAFSILQVYYLVISIYGWISWLKEKKENSGNQLSVFKLNKKILFWITIVELFLLFIIYLVLKHYTNSEIPISDSILTSLSIVATWMLYRRILEHWYFWIFIDVFSVIIFLSQNLYPTVFLYLVYSIMAIVGLKNWKKEFNSSQICVEKL